MGSRLYTLLFVTTVKLITKTLRTPTGDYMYRVIENDGRDLKPLQFKKYWTDLHVWQLKMF
jgi:hypothetical protein